MTAATAQTKESILAEQLTKPFIKTDRQAALFQKAAELADHFSKRAHGIDETAQFPFENFQELKDAGYLSLTVPKEYGGEEIKLYDYLLIQERIAQGDASTALCIGWHLGVIYDLRLKRKWKEEQFEQLCNAVIQEKKLINRCATEAATGSPTRGGKPATTAVKKGGKWIINGRKSFASMAPGLDYSLITAAIPETNEIGIFWLDHQLEGVAVEPNWDMLGMRGTRSDDLVLTEVEVDSERLVEKENGDFYQIPNAWLLHSAACFIGVAIAARNYAVKFASEYKPNSLPGPICEVPEVQRKIGEMELELLKARHMLYSIADRWDNEPQKRNQLGSELGATKHIVSNSANKVVDWAMRIVGAQSLQQKNPLQRYYRDVRAGLHNPPMDDVVIYNLAKNALAAYPQ
ncbi:alkylation response protein AidB-like acyl-CoA dehydrogenase [Cytobacillus horneckiae]|uniref:Acyl-CoA dehydrogenase n=1 Tax=Cytobacillus horneckiae TaxID=549687 RepID=A0A2N0ZEK2_9BACI|nr:acyl-CoA dehydrogenase family protein [Cytobacillus horneckiae]MBN6888088.1 acyl-CoA/acyl-ACP dehydrogenase [Cytobacillus horneckiae]MCM3176943.1 acyl-CoA/acyl-ACP dehydrogenase [Cytobacillus horneckiae]MEC1154643.1 acyl-CoA/acyl-ACP dehydrogenase [Cytobacillus horneckiae]MED2938984.1 acyl-CoA/acyl-ACP dehydrogenase [Cytobacillus horneckiae]PKG27938.1 acyl-CoA dehydrogenase [Cytobacillus horneckiae]